MNYPDLPNNRLLVNGVDLSEEFDMILIDGYTLNPPEPKTYVVDIPGGNGQIDLTETMIGDTVYKNRQQEFDFYLIDVKKFEKEKTKISNFLHGRDYNYQMTMDPEYLYHGRFSITSYAHGMYGGVRVGVIKVSIDGDPYKYKERQMRLCNAIGGDVFVFESGRKRVRPVITTGGALKIIFNHKLYILQNGTWTLPEIMFELGENELYLNSFETFTMLWGDLRTDGITWGAFGQKPLYQWYKSKGSNVSYVYKKWGDVENRVWDSYAASTWNNFRYLDYISNVVDDIQVEYDWGDL